MPEGLAGGDGLWWTPAPETSARFDTELRQTVDRAFAAATELLSARVDLLVAVTEQLLEREILEGAELAAVLDGAAAARRPKTPS